MDISMNIHIWLRKLLNWKHKQNRKHKNKAMGISRNIQINVIKKATQ